MKITGKRTILLVLAALLVAALSWGLLYLRDTKRYQDKVDGITFERLDLGRIADGVYTGVCDVDFIRAKAAVTMQDGRIQRIDLLEHKNDRGAPAEVIIAEIVRAQSLAVDTVSGATNSSKVIKKAVENALTSGISSAVTSKPPHRP